MIFFALFNVILAAKSEKEYCQVSENYLFSFIKKFSRNKIFYPYVFFRIKKFFEGEKIFEGDNIFEGKKFPDSEKFFDG